MKAVKQALLVAILVLVIVFMVQNARPTEFKFLNWTYKISQLLLVVVVLAVGFLAGFIVAKLPGRKRDE